MRHLGIIIGLWLLSGCANPINQRTAENYYSAGEQALARGDLPHAREMFSRALINAQLGHMGDAAEAQVLSKLGRVYGNLCEHDSAEKTFLEARDRYVKVYAGNPNLTFPIRAELAQFSYDVGRYAKAVQYFDEAFSVLDSRFKEADPAAYVAIRRDYADALSRIGKSDTAREVLAEAATLEGKSVTAKIGKAVDYVRYPTQCK
jgi:tetratricopeptide (TPR) repeat protein